MTDNWIISDKTCFLLYSTSICNAENIDKRLWLNYSTFERNGGQILFFSSLIVKIWNTDNAQCCHQHRLSVLCTDIGAFVKSAPISTDNRCKMCVAVRILLKNSWQLPAAAFWLCCDDCQMFLHIVCHEQPNLTSVWGMNWERGVWLLRFLPRFYYHFAPILLRLWGK